MYVNSWQTINMPQSPMHREFQACHVNRLIDLTKKSWARRGGKPCILRKNFVSLQLKREMPSEAGTKPNEKLGALGRMGQMIS